MAVVRLYNTYVVEPSVPYVTAYFRVALDQVSATSIRLDYYTIDGSATERGTRGDYLEASGTAFINAGQQEVLIPVRVYRDTIPEGIEQFKLLLLKPGNATLADGAAALLATGTIRESGSGSIAEAEAIYGPIPVAGSGSLPTLSVQNISIVEGDTGYGTARFLVTLDKPATAPVTFRYNLFDQSANRSDYFDFSSIGSIEVGGQSTVIDTRVFGDTVIEGPESLQLVVGEVRNAYLAEDAAAIVATATIIDDDEDDATGSIVGIGGAGDPIFGPASASDTLPTLRLHSPSIVEADSSYRTLSYLVTFDRVLTKFLTVDYRTSDGTATTTSGDYDLRGGTMTFQEGTKSGWITVNVLGDGLIEPDETVRLVLSRVTNAVFEGDAAALDAHSVIINDDGGAPSLAGGVGDAADLVYGSRNPGSLPTITVISTSVAEGNQSRDTVDGYDTVGTYLLLSERATTNITLRAQT